jgi:hypothetical protein
VDRAPARKLKQKEKRLLDVLSQDRKRKRKRLGEKEISKKIRKF